MVEKCDSLFEGESKTVTLRGFHFDSIARVIYQEQNLYHKIAENGKTMELAITSQMTQNPGEKEIRFILHNGLTIARELRVEPVPYWDLVPN
jgi:hypothetical protein